MNAHIPLSHAHKIMVRQYLTSADKSNFPNYVENKKINFTVYVVSVAFNSARALGEFDRGSYTSACSFGRTCSGDCRGILHIGSPAAGWIWARNVPC